MLTNKSLLLLLFFSFNIVSFLSHWIFPLILELDLFNIHSLIYLVLNLGFSLGFSEEALKFIYFIFFFLALVDSLNGKKKLNFQFFSSLFMKMSLRSLRVIFGPTVDILAFPNFKDYF